MLTKRLPSVWLVFSSDHVDIWSQTHTEICFHIGCPSALHLCVSSSCLYFQLSSLSLKIKLEAFRGSIEPLSSYSTPNFMRPVTYLQTNSSIACSTSIQDSPPSSRWPRSSITLRRHWSGVHARDVPPPRTIFMSMMKELEVDGKLQKNDDGNFPSYFFWAVVPSSSPLVLCGAASLLLLLMVLFSPFLLLGWAAIPLPLRVELCFLLSFG